MKFRKIFFPRIPQRGSLEPVSKSVWYMIIDNYEDFIKYFEIDAEYFIQAAKTLHTNLTKSHLAAPRERVLHSVFRINIGDFEGNSKSPLPQEWISKFIHSKGMAMLSILQKGKTLLIQETGSYSDFEGFMKQWEGSYVEKELVKDSTYFPTDEPPITDAFILVLENAERVDNDFLNTLISTSDDDGEFNMNTLRRENKKYKKLTLLKEKEPEWVIKSIVASPNIAFQTNALDVKQIQNMMQIFAQMPPKNFFVRLVDNAKEILESQSEWKELQKIHNIKYI